MSEEVFWVMIGSIGQCLGAVATFSAVCVALWQVKYSNKKKIKLDFEDLVTAIHGSGVVNAIAVTITNIGNKPIIISQLSIMHNDKTMALILQENQGILKKNMPVTVGVDENVTLHLLAEDFVKHVVEMVQKRKIDENKKIVFRVKDSVGKEYFVKSKRIAKMYVEKFW